MESFVELEHVVAAVHVWPEGSGSSVAVLEEGRPLLLWRGGFRDERRARGETWVLDGTFDKDKGGDVAYSMICGSVIYSMIAIPSPLARQNGS
jgi:hypothetical protein